MVMFAPTLHEAMKGPADTVIRRTHIISRWRRNRRKSHTHNRRVPSAVHSLTSLKCETNEVFCSLVWLQTRRKRCGAFAGHTETFILKVLEQTEETEGTKMAILTPTNYTVGRQDRTANVARNAVSK